MKIHPGGSGWRIRMWGTSAYSLALIIARPHPGDAHMRPHRHELCLYHSEHWIRAGCLIFRLEHLVMDS
jgi:hypothetical protein